MEHQKKQKLFRDPVHNYIAINADIRNKYIDTYLFQRLRAIEQTSMRVLYPGARHDRFIHSLGVFSLACRFFERIKPQFPSDIISGNSIERTFKIAALLHDCAHSPFSHTGEFFSTHYCLDELEQDLKTSFSQKLIEDYEMIKKKGKAPSTHEIASAYVACKSFSRSFKEDGVDKEQFARMITGITNDPIDNQAKCYNIFIRLLNGFIIDVDRLDYLLRDTWASGVNNATVDLERLISGVFVTKDLDDLIINGTAASSLINAIKARDFIYRWIIPHHKVTYASQVLTNAIEELLDTISCKYKKSKKEVACALFGYKTLLEEVKLGDEYLYMPTDGDVIYLMKKYCPKNDYAQEVLTRQFSYEPIWKSVTDFISLFPYPSDFNARKKSEFYDYFLGKVQEFNKTNNNILQISEKKTIKVTENDLKSIKVISSSIPTKRKELDFIPMVGSPPDLTIYFYVYRKKDCPKSKEDIYNIIESLYSECIQELQGNFLNV